MCDESTDADLQAWNDYHSRQQFEHQLIDRKTVWLLTTQGLLFAAYGVATSNEKTSEATQHPVDNLPMLGVLLSVLTYVGVVAVVNSKRISWVDYRERFGQSPPTFVPERAWTRSWRPDKQRHLQSDKQRHLQWGVRTSNTMVSLMPDLLYPVVFVIVWGVVAPADSALSVALIIASLMVLASVLLILAALRAEVRAPKGVHHTGPLPG